MADRSPQRKLTPKQERFCQYYTQHWTATRAAKEAGYSEKTAGIQGYQMLQNPLIQSRIKELTDAALKDIGISRERVLTELARIAFLDPAYAYDEIGQLIPIKEMPENVRRAISKVKIFEQFSGRGEERELIGFIKEVEFAPKKSALDTLAKHLGLLPERLEHSGPEGKPIETTHHSDLTDEQLNTRIQKLLSKEK
jgi:phage terminase small subunit